MIRSFTNAIAAAALVTSFGATAAVSATIVVDDFMVAQTNIAALQGNPASSSVAGPNTSILGGNRFMQVRTGGDSNLGTGLEAIGGVLSFSNDAVGTGTGWVVYDATFDRAGLSEPAVVAGLDFGASVNTTGLGGIDFLFGAPDGFFNFSATNFDNLTPGTLTFSAFAWDMLGNEVAYFESIDPLNFDPKLFYSQFRADWNDADSGLGGFDWGQVGALAFRVDSTQQGFDGQIGAITASPIPLPASVLLLLGGLGGLAGVSAAAKRRRNA